VPHSFQGVVHELISFDRYSSSSRCDHGCESAEHTTGRSDLNEPKILLLQLTDGMLVDPASTR
jgi:hypothetical protein